MVETMCRETMGPGAFKLTMRPEVQVCREGRWVRVAYSARDCKTTRLERCKEGAIVEKMYRETMQFSWDSSQLQRPN